jgi:hypothetical protein
MHSLSCRKLVTARVFVRVFHIASFLLCAVMSAGAKLGHSAPRERRSAAE